MEVFECEGFNVGGWAGEDVVYCGDVYGDSLKWGGQRING